MNRLKSGRKIFAICWVSYVAAYLCRVNFSSAMLKFEADMGVQPVMLGLSGGVFFTVYAAGQLINGFIGDKVAPHKFLIVASLGTFAVNAVIAFQNNFYIVICCWAFNGYFQSMFWGPMTRLLSRHFSEDKRANVSAGMQSTVFAGYVLSWVALGRALLSQSWRWYFIIPSAVMACISAVWIYISAKAKNKAEYRMPSQKISESIKAVRGEKITPLVLLCVCLGLVKDSLAFWMPVILVKAFQIEIEDSFLPIFLVTLANLAGIMISRSLAIKYMHKTGVILKMLFGLVIAGSAIIFASSRLSPLVAVAGVAAVSAACNGLSVILLSFIPLSFTDKGIVSSIVGVLDFSSYAGAAISSFALGLLFVGMNWDIVPVIWIAVGIIAFALCGMIKARNTPGKEIGC